MTQTTNDVSVIICAYTEDRWIELNAAVESVQHQTFVPSEIIIVIDHNPSLLRRLREHLPSGIVVVENTQARGLSGARNSGIRVASSKIIAFLDDDAVASPDWLMLLMPEFTDPQVLGIGGVVTPLWSADEPAWFPQEFYWVIGCSYRGMPQTVTAIRNPYGGNIAIRREIFDTVGGFRNGIGRIGKWPVGCEETELCIRAGQRWPQKFFLYQPQARIFHHVPASRTSMSYFCSRCYAEGLSKALVTHHVGRKDGLMSERAYTFRTLPQGLVRGIADGLFRRNPAGFLQAGAIVLGLAVTMAGYLKGTISQRSVNALPAQDTTGMLRDNHQDEPRLIEDEMLSYNTSSLDA